MANINKIRLSGTTYDIQDINVSAHTANTDIHVTLADKATWNAKLDATAYTPTVVDSALNVASTNPVQNQALYSELRLGGGETETTLVIENNYFTNYPEGCTKIKVEVVGRSGYSTIYFYDIETFLGYISINKYGSISVENYFQGATYEISGTTVIISYPTVTNVTRIQVHAYSGNYTYKAVTTEPPTVLKDQVVANTTALSGKVSTSDFNTYSGAVSSDIDSLESAVSAKLDASDFNTYSAATDNRLAEDEEVTAAALNNLNETVSAHTANTSIHVSAEQIAAWNAKSDFSGSYNDLTNKLSAGTNVSIVDNVINAEGGGKAIEAGRGISVTTGATADTVSFNLPISATTNNNLIIGDTSNNVKDPYNSGNSIVFGRYSKVKSYDSLVGGYNCSNEKGQSQVFGNYSKTKNQFEFGCGSYNNSVSGSSTFGDSGNTLFSVGNGTADNARHNAFEIRQNGDIYISSGGTDIKLQDHLGGGGSSYTAGDGIDITNDVISVTGKVSTSDFNTYSASTDSRLAEDEEVTAAALNVLNVAVSGKVSTSDFEIYSGTVETALSGKQDVSGMTAYTQNSDFTGHTANTSIHVTPAQTAAWDAKSDFSGSYNDLSNKPTIPTSASQLTNDAGYITSSALNGYATTGDVQTATNDMATKTWVGQQGYLTQHQDISGKQDVSGMTAYTETSAFAAHTDNTTVHTTAAEKTSWNGAVTALGGLKLVKLSQTQYDNLQTKNNSTLYVIVN